MANVDAREATEFVLARMKVVYLVLLDDKPVGYLPSREDAAAYAARLALQKEKLLPADAWAETCIEQQDNEFLVMRRILGLVFNSTFNPCHTVQYRPLEVLDINNIILPEVVPDVAVGSDSDSDSGSDSDSDSGSGSDSDRDSGGGSDSDSD